MHRYVGLLWLLIAAGCAARHESVRGQQPALQPAANQVVIGELRGADGKPVVTRPGVYRVGLRGEDRLDEIYWNRLEPLKVTWTGGGPCTVHLNGRER